MSTSQFAHAKKCISTDCSWVQCNSNFITSPPHLNVSFTNLQEVYAVTVGTFKKQSNTIPWYWLYNTMTIDYGCPSKSKPKLGLLYEPLHSWWNSSPAFGMIFAIHILTSFWVIYCPVGQILTWALLWSIFTSWVNESWCSLQTKSISASYFINSFGVVQWRFCTIYIFKIYMCCKLCLIYSVSSFLTLSFQWFCCSPSYFHKKPCMTGYSSFVHNLCF